MDPSLRLLGPKVVVRTSGDLPGEIHGKHISLCRLQPNHAEDLYTVTAGKDYLWDYMFDEPPSSLLAFEEKVKAKSQNVDRIYYAILSNRPQQCIGHLALISFNATSGVVELGDVLFSPALQRTAAATEAFYLVSRVVFEDLNYRRFEWKCNDLNVPSKRAAERLGFQYEGLFRQHLIIKGRSRDTAWYSIIDKEWPSVKETFEMWLDEGNFKAGVQKVGLKELRQKIIESHKTFSA